MIISRTPFRISFIGGGSDLPSFYTKERGAVISVTINKYMYISIHPFFNRKQINLKYSKTELCSNVNQINHPIFRETLKYLKFNGGIEIVSTADIPSGTGLGSSSSFTVGLLHSLYSFKGKFISKSRLASEACMIEIKKLGKPIGKQDQYAAVFGGLNVIVFNTDGSVNVKPISLKMSTIKKLKKNLILFYTKVNRDANAILKDQNENIKLIDKFNVQKKMVDLVWEAQESLYNNDLNNFGKILHRGWELKKMLSGKISNTVIDKYYDKAMEHGAIGGKLLGAGGGGFLLFYCESGKQETLRKALFDLHELKFAFDCQGSEIIYTGDKSYSDNAGFYE